MGLVLLALVLAIALCPPAHAAVLYESATLGETGVTGPSAGVSYDQWFGVRFQVTQAALATSIGGHFVTGIPGLTGPFFGALVRLSDMSDFPDTEPVVAFERDQVKGYSWDGPDILAKVSLTAPRVSADIRAEFPGGGLVLAPGSYGLVFGTAASSSRVGMVTGGSDIGAVSGFAWIAWSELSPGYPLPDAWYEGYRAPGTRFVVETDDRVMPAPAAGSAYVFPAVGRPILDPDPGRAMPFSIGTDPAALTLQTGLLRFTAPVDVYVAIHAPAVSPEIWFLRSDNTIQPLSSGPAKWKENVTGPVYETLFGSIPKNVLPKGIYNFHVAVTPTGDIGAYYLWTTSFENR